MDPSTEALREELAELTAALRAHVEWQAETGASGLPAGPLPDELRALLDRPAISSPEVSPAPASTPVAAPAPPPARAVEQPPARAVEQPAARPHQPSPPRRATEPSSGPDERVTRLALLAEEARSCTKCRLHTKRKQAVFARGNPFAELCFVGEGPGADEDAQGEPFVGKAGQLLDRMIAAMGYQRDEVYICNIVKCRPPENRKPEPDEMAACSPFAVQQIGLVKPKALVALGATAVQAMMGTTEGITRLRGRMKMYKGIPMMPTFHPAYLLRNPDAKREVWADLQEVMKLLGKPLPGRR